MDEFCSKGKESTRLRRQRGMRVEAFDLIRHKKLIEITGDDFRAVLAQGGVIANCDLKCLHNLALGWGWLPWLIIPYKLWPKPEMKEKRAITWDEHQRIVRCEKNTERRLYYKVLWEIGAGQTDAAELTVENIDWHTRVLSYERKKTGEWCYLAIGSQLENLLRQLPSDGPLFPKIKQLQMETGQQSFAGAAGFCRSKASPCTPTAMPAQSERGLLRFAEPAANRA